ncbi:MAG: hypothetical protein IJB34_00260 [Clostridia bacterium]|nr:hypothetical protein [Clostridia bacterium]
MIFDIKDYGAIPDGKTLNTRAIQKAIDDCEKHGGGRVLIEGGKFLSGSIELKSNTELYLAANAVLIGSEDCKDYPERSNVKHVKTKWLPRAKNASFIFADECENISICGLGKIDCNGDKFVYKYRDTYWKYCRRDAATPPRAVFFTGCKNVKVEDITLENLPAGWGYWIHDCDVVTIDRAKIFANVDYPNNDGIHINCSRSVTVSNCNIVCGDDCIVVRANSVSLKENKVCEKVCVTNCNLTSYSGGIRIGWCKDGVIRNCVFSNLVMTDTTVGISILLPYLRREAPENMTDVGREETLIENLSFNNIIMNRICSNSILIDVAYSPEMPITGIRNLYFSNIHASGCEFPTLLGRSDNYLKNICFSDCTFEITDGSEFPNRFAHGATSHNDGQYHAPRVRYVENIKFNNTEFKVN